MKDLARTVIAIAVGACVMFGSSMSWSADAPKKNWIPPSHKIYGQKLCDETMARHPELISVTLHGVPPGLDAVYTMFAGSFPDRIGNPDDSVDLLPPIAGG